MVDPASNESLGSVKVTKSRVRATQVFEKFTIATTSWTYTSYDPFPGGILSGMETVKIDEGELNVNLKDIRPWRANSESPVKVGDEVEVQVDIDEDGEDEEEEEEDEEPASDTNSALAPSSEA